MKGDVHPPNRDFSALSIFSTDASAILPNQ
jgi:hypothetical protein